MKTLRIPQWLSTAFLVLVVAVIGYFAVSNIERTRRASETSAQTDVEAGMIAYMDQQYDRQHPRRDFHWTIQKRTGQHYLVCYCDGRGYGWWYDVLTTSVGEYSATQVADTSAAAATPNPKLPNGIP